MVEIVDCVEYLLRNAALDASSSNIFLLKNIFDSGKNHDLLCNSSIFEWVRRTALASSGSPRGCCPSSSNSLIATSEVHSREDDHDNEHVNGSADDGLDGSGNLVHFFNTRSKFRQLSAKLHCLYGVPIQHVPRPAPTSSHHNLRANRGARLHPFARSLVYDLRQHAESSLWGPFAMDGSQGVDWEKLEGLIVILSYNIQRFADRYSAHDLEFFPPWSSPFVGATPYSLKEIERPPPLPLDLRDPYNVSGRWMRVVCFLDYREFFTFNFSEDQPLANQSRPPIDTEEAIRFIVVNLHVASIQAPGENDGKELPVVHFNGESTSALPPVDPNANSKIRGTVRLTPKGDVRWTTLSVFHGEERWRSEGIQIGGVQAARGVVGFWFDKDFDPYGPAGPTAFWKA
ncbi:MAG: hypothetical protein Q9219_000366 [cf. Caloplaca sp. 3 TL-2023]